MLIEIKELVMMRDEAGNEITLTKVKSHGWMADIKPVYGDIQIGAKVYQKKAQAMTWARNKFAELERETYPD